MSKDSDIPPDIRPPAAVPYTVSLQLEGWPVVVVGGGVVATRKVQGLLNSGAQVRVIAPEVSPELAQLAMDARLEWLPRAYESGDITGSRLAFAATNQGLVNHAVATEARERGILLYRADEAFQSDFHTPAVFHGAGLVGSVQTLGVAPLVAAYVRRRLEEFTQTHLSAPVEAMTEIRRRVRSLALPPPVRAEILRLSMAAMIQRLDGGQSLEDIIAAGEHQVQEKLRQLGQQSSGDLVSQFSEVRVVPQMDEERAMARALHLSRRAQGRTSPNPMVGALVLDSDGTVLGEGWHPGPGQPHAEIMALRHAIAQGKGDRIRGATMVVTLEPCCHHGRTGPCTQAIIEAGIRRVVAACEDPNPQVAGQGFDLLRHAGISVKSGVLEDQARALHAPFFTALQLGRPLVTAKWAMTLDGRLAAETGNSRWITGPTARIHVHQQRAGHDAILVGIGTLLADNPELTVRLNPGDWPVPGVEPVQPRLLIVDGGLRTPPNARALHSQGVWPAGREPVILSGELVDDAMGQRAAALRSVGCQILHLPAESQPGYGDLSRFLNLAFQDLGILSVYCEGGGRLQGQLLAAGLVDRIHGYMAAKIVGGDPRFVPLNGPGWPTLEQAPVLESVEIQFLGPDLWVMGWLPKSFRRR